MYGNRPSENYTHMMGCRIIFYQFDYDQRLCHTYIGMNICWNFPFVPIVVPLSIERQLDCSFMYLSYVLLPKRLFAFHQP